MGWGRGAWGEEGVAEECGRRQYVGEEAGSELGWMGCRCWTGRRGAEGCWCQFVHPHEHLLRAFIPSNAHPSDT